MALPDYATNIALVNTDTNTIANIIWGYIYDTSFIAENEILVPVYDLYVQIGDSYNEEEDAFYHNGVKVLTRDETHLNEVADIIEQIYEEDEEMIGE